MRFAGIDIGGERHAVAVVNGDGRLLIKSTLFEEEASGYQHLHDAWVIQTTAWFRWRRGARRVYFKMQLRMLFRDTVSWRMHCG
jgi:hypothetical protein